MNIEAGRNFPTATNTGSARGAFAMIMLGTGPTIVPVMGLLAMATSCYVGENMERDS
jgi:hypothetical protein